MNDCWNANPVSMLAALEDLVERSKAVGPSPCLARWPSSEPSRIPTIARSDRSSRRSTSACSSPSARADTCTSRAPKACPRSRVRPTPRRPPGSFRASSRPATACSSRDRVRSGSRSSPTRWPGSATRLSRRWYGSHRGVLPSSVDAPRASSMAYLGSRPSPAATSTERRGLTITSSRRARRRLAG